MTGVFLRRDMRDNYERERETVRLNGDWGQSQSQSQRHPTVRTITAVVGAQQSQQVRPSTL